MIIKIRGKKYRLTDRFFGIVCCLLVVALTLYMCKQIDYELSLMGY